MALKVAFWTRWLHIYLSMFGMAALVFFSVTGITLNHPDWVFSDAERSSQAEGRVPSEWLNLSSAASPDDRVDKLKVVESLRAAHGVRGALSEFRVDDRDCTVAFKGPGYSADIFLDRQTGKYTLTQMSHGLMAVVNDLHKGRDSGGAWSVLIDVSAGILIVIALSGLGLLFYLKRRRIPGLVLGILGAIVIALVAWFWVP